MEALTVLSCPQCKSDKSFRNGTRRLADGTIVQRYICRDCSYRYTIPQNLNSVQDNEEFSQISANFKVKNLVDPSTQENVEGDEIKTFLWWMKKQGYRESTIISRGNRLRRLVTLKAILSDPETVKEVIAKQDHWKDSQKQAVVFAYDLYAKWSKKTWDRPYYEAIRELPFIPQEREIDDLIAGVNKEIALFLQIAKESGARAGEIFAIQWTHIDFERHTIAIAAEKHSNPRMLKMSKKLQNMLECYPQKTEKIFSKYGSLNNLRRTFERQRKRLSVKLANPRLQKITFHTLRHWKGTMEYHKTKDILHVMQTLGHKNIKNTLLYTQLVKDEEDNGWICKIARTPEEAVPLIEQGFEFHTEYDGAKLFRKRK